MCVSLCVSERVIVLKEQTHVTKYLYLSIYRNEIQLVTECTCLDFLLELLARRVEPLSQV